MKESHRKGVAHHLDPESCGCCRKAATEALTGAHADQVSSCEIMSSRTPMPLTEAEGHTAEGDRREPSAGPAQSKTLCMCGNSLHGTWEIPRTPAADGPAGRAGVSIGLQRVREVAHQDKEVRFTALLHHVSTDLLRESYYALQRKAAPGVDGETWETYGLDLETRIKDLHARVHRGAYRAKPSRRTYIPKADGRQRPLGVAAVEDKILQQALVTVLQSIYEEDFLGFSYGFRPGRSPHDALDALWVGITRRKVNWVLDADIRGFFDTINHEWMMKFLEHRIADRRVLRLIRQWLKAGILEDGSWSETELGTP